MANTTTVLEADGTDSEACFAGTIAGYNGNNRIQTKEEFVSTNESSSWDSVKWGVKTLVQEVLDLIWINSHNACVGTDNSYLYYRSQWSEYCCHGCER